MPLGLLYNIPNENVKGIFIYRARYRWQKTLVLTPDEGKSLEKIYTQLGYTNVSQFCKAISHGELEVSRCDMPPDNKMQAFSHYRNVYKNLD